MEEEFGKVLDEMFQLYQRKNHDYGNSFSTIYKKIGMPYALGHILEKTERLATLHESGNMVNESFRDSLIDLANYAVLTIIELDKQKQ